MAGDIAGPRAPNLKLMSIYGYKKKTKKALWKAIQDETTPAAKPDHPWKRKVADKNKTTGKARWTPAQQKRVERMRLPGEKPGPKPGKVKVVKRKPVRQVSKKKAKSDRLYNAMVKEWLAEGRVCNVYAALLPKANICCVTATQCHHKRGRLGTLKFDKRFWLPVCGQGHQFIDANRKKAITYDLLAGPGEWHVAPKDAETERIKEWMRANGI